MHGQMSSHQDVPPIDDEVAEAVESARQAMDRLDPDGAEEALALAAERDPDHWEIHHLRGVISARKKDWANAEAHFQRAHQLNPTHPGPLTNLGNLRTEHKQYDEAITYYEQALAFDPDYANAHHNLAVALRRVGRLDESIRHLKRAQRLDAKAPERSGRKGAPSAAGWLLLLGAIAMLAAVFWFR